MLPFKKKYIRNTNSYNNKDLNIPVKFQKEGRKKGDLSTAKECLNSHQVLEESVNDLMVSCPIDQQIALFKECVQ